MLPSPETPLVLALELLSSGEDGNGALLEVSDDDGDDGVSAVSSTAKHCAI